jgi:alpha-glucosidase
VVQNTTEESLDPLTLLVSPDELGNASGLLFEDAGDGYGYQSGDFLSTTYRAETHNGQVVVSVAASVGQRARPKRPVEVEVVTDQGIFRGSGTDGQPIAVSLN